MILSLVSSLGSSASGLRRPRFALVGAIALVVGLTACDRGGSLDSPDDDGQAELEAPERPSFPAPDGVSDVLIGPHASNPDALAAWVRDHTLMREVRVAALSRLERIDPERAVSTSLTLLREAPPKLLRTNALALLVRSSDPRADATLNGLAGRELELVQALNQRGR